MTEIRGNVEVTISMHIRDVLTVIHQRYGSQGKLRKHIDKHPGDKAAIMLWDTARRHKGNPDEIVEFGEMLIGDLREILGPAQLELMAVLMSRPGIGIRELARNLGKNPATVLEQVADLEQAGLVSRESTGPGKRAVIRPLATELTIRVSAEA